MTRFAMPLTPCLLACALVCAPAGADDPPKKLTAEERTKLEDRWNELGVEAMTAYRGGKYPEATKAFEQGLEIARRLYPKTEFPDGHVALAASINNLAGLYETMGRYADAARLHADALAMRQRLFKGDHSHVAGSLNNLANVHRAQGRYADAAQLYAGALAMRQRLFKGDHPSVAASLNNLASTYQDQGRYAAAAPLFRDALAMRQRLFKGDHPDVADSLNSLGGLHYAQGRYADAAQLYAGALAMRQRLFKGDHPSVAASLNNLSLLYREQDRHDDAVRLQTESREMLERLFKGDHPSIAMSLNNLAGLYRARSRFADAAPLYAGALAMRQRLFKGDHPDVADSLNNLAGLHRAQGRLADAAPLYAGALAMRQRLFKGDHPDVAHALNNLAVVHRAQERFADAARTHRDAMDMYRRLATRFALDRSEGEALTLVASSPLTRDGFLSTERARRPDPSSVYAQLWLDKGYLARVYELRQRQARAASDPTAAQLLTELTAARRRRAELLVAPATGDRATLDQRAMDLKGYEDRIEKLAPELNERLPAVARADRLGAAAPADMQKALPVDTAVIDYLRYTHFEQNPKTPSEAGETRTPRYLAFVVTKGTVAWVDLGAAAAIEPAVDAWRDGITAGKEIPPAMAAKVRELVWEKVRKELPANTKTVYVCPDAALCRLPFAALPGDKPGTVLLDDYAIATIPHAPFLLDKLWPQDKPTSTPTGALVVGGVKYDAAAAPPAKDAPAPGPLVIPDAKLVWKALPNTVGEAAGVAGAAERKKLTPTRLDGDKATTAAVLAALPKAKVAHLATHGFFADPSFRGVFNLDPKDFEMRGGERVGRVVNSPLLMTGLVFAGANDPKAPGRGILTGEQLIDLDLSGLELAVLSACETGVGDVADGQGVFGLQRALHYAGATNVVCSLWKVPDESTAALMGAFYRNLWDKGLAPVEALRQAQLELYRNPGAIPELAKGFRGVFEEVDGPKVEAKAAGGKAHPLLWAAFTLSGPGK